MFRPIRCQASSARPPRRVGRRPPAQPNHHALQPRRGRNLDRLDRHLDAGAFLPRGGKTVAQPAPLSVLPAGRLGDRAARRSCCWRRPGSPDGNACRRPGAASAFSSSESVLPNCRGQQLDALRQIERQFDRRPLLAFFRNDDAHRHRTRDVRGQHHRRLVEIRLRPGHGEVARTVWGDLAALRLRLAEHVQFVARAQPGRIHPQTHPASVRRQVRKPQAVNPTLAAVVGDSQPPGVVRTPARELGHLLVLLAVGTHQGFDPDRDADPGLLRAAQEPDGDFVDPRFLPQIDGHVHPAAVRPAHRRAIEPDLAVRATRQLAIGQIRGVAIALGREPIIRRRSENDRPAGSQILAARQRRQLGRAHPVGGAAQARNQRKGVNQAGIHASGLRHSRSDSEGHRLRSRLIQRRALAHQKPSTERGCWLAVATRFWLSACCRSPGHVTIRPAAV